MAFKRHPNASTHWIMDDISKIWSVVRHQKVALVV
jgi:hypothetical protein